MVALTIFPIPIAGQDFYRQTRGLSEDNVVPFATIAWQLLHLSLNTVRQLVGNIAGARAARASTARTCGRRCATGAGSCSWRSRSASAIELTQFAGSLLEGFTYRVTDVDDAIMNATGRDRRLRCVWRGRSASSRDRPRLGRGRRGRGIRRRARVRGMAPDSLARLTAEVVGLPPLPPAGGVARGGGRGPAGALRRRALLGPAAARLRRPGGAHPASWDSPRPPTAAIVPAASSPAIDRATSCSPRSTGPGSPTSPTSIAADDGLTLRGVYVAAVVRCAPPDNKPLARRARHAACRTWSARSRCWPSCG